MTLTTKILISDCHVSEWGLIWSDWGSRELLCSGLSRRETWHRADDFWTMSSRRPFWLRFHSWFSPFGSVQLEEGFVKSLDCSVSSNQEARFMLITFWILTSAYRMWYALFFLFSWIQAFRQHVIKHCLSSLTDCTKCMSIWTFPHLFSPDYGIHQPIKRVSRLIKILLGK